MIQAHGKPVAVKTRKDIEPLRDYYNKLGGAKLVHSETVKQWRQENNLARDFFNDGVLRSAREWIVDDQPHILKLEDYDPDTPNWNRAMRLYEFAKFLWLANDLKYHTPINIPQAHFENNSLEIHPGSVTNVVRDYLDIDFEFMLWDNEHAFPQIETLTFDEWADLVPLPSKDGDWKSNEAHDHYYTELHTTQYAIEIWVNSMDFRIKLYEFYDYFHSKINNKVKIFIGYDSKHTTMSKVCERSIRKYNQEIEIEFLDINAIPEYIREWDKQTTEFTYSRFLVPWLMNYEGVGIFCDDDFVWQCDPVELLYSLEPDKAVSVVKHNFKKDLSGKKLDNQDNVMYPKKLWSSLMMFNCGHSDCHNLTPKEVNEKSGQWLHQFYWTNNIGSLPHTYNWCEGSCDYCTEAFGTLDDAKVIHYTRGGPWLPGNWDHIQGLEYWNKHNV